MRFTVISLFAKLQKVTENVLLLTLNPLAPHFTGRFYASLSASTIILLPFNQSPATKGVLYIGDTLNCDSCGTID